MSVNRRRFAASGLVSGLALFTGRRATPTPAEPVQPLDWVGRVFVNESRAGGIDSISVTVWRYSSEDLAATARVDLAEQATAPDLADDVSIVEVEEFQLSSLPGSLKSWIEVVGDGTAETLFGGGFFQRDVFVWSILTTGEDRDAMFSLITEVGHDLLSRGVPSTPEVEHRFVGGMWNLVPEERDLPDGFSLYQFIEHGHAFTPEGTPIPPFEATGPFGNQRG